ncbi:MAG: chemotaxis protein CheA [Kofleriaceae bacterium]|nr:chemotaxis protein CheA [Kofleriaceae bacterium]
MTDKVDLQEFVGGFIAESEQLVASATAGLLEIERANAKGDLRPKTVRDVFRALHTLKGLAGMMGVQPIVELAHAFETVVRAGDQSGGRLGARAVELGLVTIRGIADRVRAVAMKTEVAPAPEALLDELSRVDAAGAGAHAKVSLASAWDGKLGEGERQQVSAAVAAGKKIYSLTFTPSEARSAQGVSIATVRASLMKLGELVKVLPRALPQSPDSPAGLAFDMLIVSTAEPNVLADTAHCPADQVIAVAAAEPAEPAAALLPMDEVAPVSTVGRSFVRVELARLDELQDQLSALVVSRFRLERQLASLGAAGVDVRALREIAEVQARQLRDLRRGILRARMVRVAEVLEPLWLLVRSLVQPGIKEARLELDVNDSELDKAVADRLLPAIVHLVRNAVDHAIEPINERERAGKSRVGRVRITCRERAGNQLELEVSDDGRGIDREAIARRAGRAIADETEHLDVLATPGFSTRDKATQTSGRGYGMDIVRRVAVHELGGELRLATEPNVGTTFALQVPLTIAIIDVFSFECARQAFVVPVAAIEEIFELSDHVRIEGPRAAKGQLPVTMCERRGRPVPIVPLGTLLKIDRVAERASKALVIRRNGEPLAFAVDRMLGRHEVVVRPIEDVLARAPGIAGATDLGDGRPTLLLDLVELGAGITAWRAEAS